MPYMVVINKIKLIALSLPVEQSMTGVCPICNGGASKDKSLSITRIREGLLYNCFRAKCSGCRGFISSSDISGEKSEDRKYSGRGGKGKVYEPSCYPAKQLSSEERAFICGRFGLASRELDTLCNGRTPRGDYYFPIYGQRGETRGTVDRSYAGRKPKTITRWYDDDSPRLHWDASAQGGKKAWVVVVEDQISALKVGRYVPAVALLGCHLTPKAARELMQYTDRLLIALDPDALRMAIKLRNQYYLNFKEIKVQQLDCDPKDMNKEELEQWLLM